MDLMLVVHYHFIFEIWTLTYRTRFRKGYFKEEGGKLLQVLV
jgi:hypothetical protein